MSARRQTDVILLDFSKAFDKVPHKRLLGKLHYYGVRHQVLMWIGCFLHDRHQKVVLEGSCSQASPVTSGVPQGTVLGPLLFLAYINDLPLAVSSHIRLFADDCIVYRTINNASDATSLQQDLNRLQEWEKTWQMTFHPEKCQVLRVTNKRNPLMAEYTIHGHILQVTDNAKYLGVNMDSKLNWNYHVSQTANGRHPTRLQQSLR